MIPDFTRVWMAPLPTPIPGRCFGACRHGFAVTRVKPYSTIREGLAYAVLNHGGEPEANNRGIEGHGWITGSTFRCRDRKVVVMKDADVNRYRTVLLMKREEIADRTPQREELWIVPSNEQIETVQLAGEREFTARTMEREAKSLMQIGAALKRISAGEFGICLECEEPIAPKRLAAVPWAAYCLHCQEMHDAQEATHPGEPKLAA
ncbi:MAG: TraR/DksA family transcriptional regulator [Candidatus Solibacter sp.]